MKQSAVADTETCRGGEVLGDVAGVGGGDSDSHIRKFDKTDCELVQVGFGD